MKQIIKEVLQRSRNHCKFKSAFLPEGWTCVNIEKCSEDIEKAIREDNKKEVKE